MSKPSPNPPPPIPTPIRHPVNRYLTHASPGLVIHCPDDSASQASVMWNVVVAVA